MIIVCFLICLVVVGFLCWKVVVVVLDYFLAG